MYFEHSDGNQDLTDRRHLLREKILFYTAVIDNKYKLTHTVRMPSLSIPEDQGSNYNPRHQPTLLKDQLLKCHTVMPHTRYFRKVTSQESRELSDLAYNMVYIRDVELYSCCGYLFYTCILTFSCIWSCYRCSLLTFSCIWSCYRCSQVVTSSPLHSLTSSLSSPLPSGSQMSQARHQWSGRWQ